VNECALKQCKHSSVVFKIPQASEPVPQKHTSTTETAGNTRKGKQSLFPFMQITCFNVFVHGIRWPENYRIEIERKDMHK